MIHGMQAQTPLPARSITDRDEVSSCRRFKSEEIKALYRDHHHARICRISHSPIGTRWLSVLVNPTPDRLADPESQPRSRAHDHDRNDQVHHEFLRLAQAPERAAAATALQRFPLPQQLGFAGPDGTLLC